MNHLLKIIKEPLLHFLVLGACLFALYQWTGNDTPKTLSDEIVVTPGRINNMISLFNKTRQRDPSTTELEGLIQSHIQEEILYREALALGLDRDDTIIRRRLRQKMEFLSEDLLSPPPPSDDELNAYLNKHSNSFQLDASFSFQHIFLNAETRGDTIHSEAQQLLQQLQQNDESIVPLELGDRFLRGHHFEIFSELELFNTFGHPFIDPLREAPPHQWVGPIPSTYGLHLVLINKKVDRRTPPLAEVRERVLREWTVEKITQANEAFYAALQTRYAITIQRPQLKPASDSQP